MISKGVKSIFPIQHQELWDKYRIFVVAINHDEFTGCRVTPHVYTTIEEIDRFADAMENIIKNGVSS